MLDPDLKGKRTRIHGNYHLVNAVQGNIRCLF
jgi:hypothetical protein